jgi:hypothetical protein
MMHACAGTEDVEDEKDVLPFIVKNSPSKPGMVAHTFNPNTLEAEAGGFLSLRPAWSTECVPEQPGGLHGKNLSQKTKKKKKKKECGITGSLLSCYLLVKIKRMS